MHEIVPIHINNPIHPNSANKHKRLGLQMLNELTRIEMFVTRIETVGKVKSKCHDVNVPIVKEEETGGGGETGTTEHTMNGGTDNIWTRNILLSTTR